MKHYAAIRKRSVFVVVFILTGLIYYFGIREESIQKSKMRLFKIDEDYLSRGFLVHTPGCRIPEMDPYDESVLKYLNAINFEKCDKKPPLIESNQTTIWIVPEALENYNASELSDLECCYSEFWRTPVPDSSSKNIDGDADNQIEMSTTCISFNESAVIDVEFIKVECKANGMLVYQDFHAFIIPKSKGVPSNQSGISILILGLDSVSRLNFHRQMLKTRKMMSLLGAVEFFGYNKVQDNTFPNLVPLLSGHSIDEIKFCWPEKNLFFDECPWIWKDFSSNNYFTAFGEDACWMGIFNYLKPGFLHPPTDYYVRPYLLNSERVIGHTRPLNSDFCIGARYAPDVLLNYAYKFSVNMTRRNNKFWGLFWESSLTHDFLNFPSKTDNIFHDFFEKLKEENILNTTAIFFLSDHGMRWGDIRTTYQGRMEEHLPFLYVILPNWFKQRYTGAMANLRRNSHFLATHFDVYETMKDLMNLETLSGENLVSRVLETRDKRANSLFLPVPLERTCKSAGIEPTWCTCQRNREVSERDSHVQKAANVTIDFLNNMLKDYEQCAQLSLEKIMSAHLEVEDELLSTDSESVVSDYVVTIITVPGHAKFESVVRHRSGTNEMSVVGDISRINLYGSQSKCDLKTEVPKELPNILAYRLTAKPFVCKMQEAIIRGSLRSFKSMGSPDYPQSLLEEWLSNELSPFRRT